jgi:hypothetical protein
MGTTPAQMDALENVWLDGNAIVAQLTAPDVAASTT